MIDATGSEIGPAPEYPCFEHPTLTDLLESQGVTWRYYAATCGCVLDWTECDLHMCQPQTINGNPRVFRPGLDQ